MCLLVLAWQHDPDYPLLLAANRDEFYQRPTRSGRWWPEFPQCWGGQDLQAGGSWFVINRAGYWAALTNVREGSGKADHLRSRGELVSGYLRQLEMDTEHEDSRSPYSLSAFDYALQVLEQGHHYAGFNLLLGSPDEVIYCSNRLPWPERLQPGLYTLSNARLHSHWPKTQQARQAMQHWLAAGRDLPSLPRLLGSRQQAPTAELPDTGISLEWEQRLSSCFIASPGYGTRSSLGLSRDQEGLISVRECSFSPGGYAFQQTCESWHVRGRNGFAA